MRAIAKALEALPAADYLLAVSGGRDSMALLDAFAVTRREALSAVATFDHGTGAAATEAVALVVRESLRRGVSVVAGRAPGQPRSVRASESVLRAARWSFLRAVAEERRAVIVTAHTRDDQAETVALRILRDASTRGLAAMAVSVPGVVRPLLDITRSALARYGEAAHVPYVEDPSNTDVGYLRNRLRADLMSAVESARPGFRDQLVALGAQAARWRSDFARLVDSLGAQRVGNALVIDAAPLDGMTVESHAIIWPELAGRVGVVLDRRGIERLADWAPGAKPGQRSPLSGGAVVERTARTFVVRRL